MKQPPLILQNRRREEFFGPEDWTGGDPDDDVRAIKSSQLEWDQAYQSLTFWQRVRYNMFGFWFSKDKP